MDVYLVQPRGFCAGVRRAIDIVHKILQEYGAPIYVRHEIVHNKHVIENLKSQGVIFVEELEEVSDKTRPVIFSAHGVSEKIKKQAQELKLNVIDATCPLVNAIHQKIKKLEKDNANIIVIGKETHPEIQGTLGQLSNPQIAHVINKISDIERLTINNSKALGVVTQTTLSVDDTKDIMDALRKKFSSSKDKYSNICFATTNRQKAVQELANKTKNIIIIGSKNSSNSTNLKNAAVKYGAEKAWLIDDVSEVDWGALDKCQTIGVSAGASAPDYLVDELITALRTRYDNINIHDVIVTEENTHFK